MNVCVRGMWKGAIDFMRTHHMCPHVLRSATYTYLANRSLVVSRRRRSTGNREITRQSTAERLQYTLTYASV